MSRPRHPDKSIENAVQYAESLGWRVKLSNGHAWGRLFCPLTTRDGCIVGVYSTPRDPDNHARAITRRVDSCPHQVAGTADDEDTGPPGPARDTPR